MTDKDINRFSGVIHIISGIIFLAWWLSMGLLLPQAEAMENFNVIVTHSNWVPINVIGLIAVMLWSLSFYLQYNSFSKKLSKTGFIGFVSGQIGIIWFACIQYYETFIWPIVGQSHGEFRCGSGRANQPPCTPGSSSV